MTDQLTILKIKKFNYTQRVVNSFFVQKNCIHATYSVKILNEQNTFKGNSDLRQMFNNAIQNSNNVKFSLFVDKELNKSIFLSENNNTLQVSEKKSANNVLIFAGYSGKVYNFENKIFKESYLIGNKFLIKEEEKESWILTNETKIIDSFLCYKATSFNVVKYNEKIFKHPIIAWYCPSIPINHGPNGYGGLSGLIIELQVRNVFFSLHKIDFNSNQILNFDDVNKKKIITKKQYNKKLDEVNDFKG